MTRIFRTPVLGLAVLVSGAGLLLMAACGGSSNAATQASASPVSSVAVHQATTAPAAATTAPTAAPTATPAPATPAPATPAPATPAPVPTDAPQVTAPVDVNVTLAEWNIQSSLAVFHVGVPYHFIITNNGKIAHEVNFANIDARPVAPGATVTLDITFPSQAQAEFACHLPSHYEAGMKLPVTIEP